MNSRLKRINKMKMVTLWVICVLVALFFKFSMVTPTYAYYLNNEGNILSTNLIDNSNFINEGGSNGVASDTGLTIQNQTSLNWGKYCSYELSLNSGTYTLSFYQSPSTLVYIFVNDVQVFGDGQNVRDNMIITFNVGSDNSNINIRFYTTCIITNLMLNEGSNALTYERFGIWYNENAYETQKYLASLTHIYELFNGASVILKGNGEDSLATGTISLNNNNSGTLSYDDLPSSIKDYINNHYNIDFEIDIILSKQTNASLYLNSNYNTIACSVYHDYNGGFPLNDNYYRQFNASFNTNNYLINPTFNYNYLNIYYINTTNDNFNISISSDNYFYRDGYNDGYNNGYNVGTGDGYNNGYNVGKVDGYNNGYNEGEQLDFASSGFKTLITTILSYPVNMVKESLNFEFMGIHIANIVLFLISLGIVAFVIKRFKD